MAKKSILVCFLAVFAVCFASSLFILPSETSYLDDEVNLAPLRSLEESPSQFQYLVTSNQSGLFGRSVSMASLGLDVLLFDFSYKQFKKTNVVLHLINAVLVALFSMLLFCWYGLSKRTSGLLAACVSVFWFVLPIHVSTIMYPVQRMAQLSAMFVLAGVILYGFGRNLLLRGTKERLGGCLVAVSILLCLPLGLLSKENAILLLPLMFLVELTFFRKDATAAGKSIRTMWSVGIGVALIVTVWFWRDIVNYLNADYRDRTPSQGLLTQTRILLDYLSGIIVPSNSGFGYFHDDIEVSRSLFDPIQTVFSVAALIGILAVSAYRALLYRSLIAFGFLFFFIGHGLESSILPLELYFEHRNYLPSIGIVVALVASGYLIARKTRAQFLISFFFVGYLMVAAFVSLERNIIWNTPDVGIALSAINHPDSPRSIAGLAIFQADSGFYDSSKRNLAKVQDIKPSLYAAVEVQKLYADCVNFLPVTKEELAFFSSEFEVGISQYFNQGLSLLTAALESGRCRSIEPVALRAFSDYFLANTKVPASTHKRMGELLLAGGEEKRAVEHLMRSWDAKRLDVRSAILLFELLVAQGQYNRATLMIEKLDSMVSESGVPRWQIIYAEAKSYLGKVK